MNRLQVRITNLLMELRRGIFEKETETALALLAALAGESILLLGPPGVAKSMVARRLKCAFAQANTFEYLMSRFSTPDELFGPVSIARLKEADCYERATNGYLPTADVVFLDEIWKAGPAIQNTLLTVMNEKLFRNGDKEVHLPLKLLVAASNELPAKDEGLEALWDRFIIRIVCRGIECEDTFRKMLLANEAEENIDTPSECITAEEYAQWQAEAKRLPINENTLNAICYLRQALEKVETGTSDLPRRIYVSDRRWKHIATLLRTSAYIQGRSEATVEDLLPIYHCLWNEPEEIEEVKRMTISAILAPINKALDNLSRCVKADLRACNAQAALQKALRDNDHRDDGLVIADRYFYRIENHGSGHTYVYITDFKQMPMLHVGPRTTQPTRGIIYTDPQNSKHRIVRMLTPDFNPTPDLSDTEAVTLGRDNEHIYINGVRFKMLRQGASVKSPVAGIFNTYSECSHTTYTNAKAEENIAPTSTHYENDIEYICNNLDQTVARMQKNLFANHSDLQATEQAAHLLYRKIALTRADIRKLLYDEA